MILDNSFFITATANLIVVECLLQVWRASGLILGWVKSKTEKFNTCCFHV